MEDTMTGTGVGAPPATESETTFAVTNVLGIASTLTSVGLLGATGYLLFRQQKPPMWFLWLVAGKMGLDIVQAGWVASLFRKEQAQITAPPITPAEGSL